MMDINKDTLDICVITYNRLEYLKNCVWSILASTKVKYRLTVIDDCSSDGTAEWLKQMKKNDKINTVIINEENLGSPKTINKAIRSTSSKVVAVISDDFWIHRGWDITSIKTFNSYKNCGMLSFWNFPIARFKNRNTKELRDTYLHQEIGVAALLLSRELFDKVGGYKLPDGVKMGYFSRIFCQDARKTNSVRKFQYLLKHNYADQMDRNNPGETRLPPPKLSQDYLYKNYNVKRSEEKHKHKNAIYLKGKNNNKI